MEQLESRFALTVPVAVDDFTPADLPAMTVNDQSVQLNVALNDHDDLGFNNLTVLVATGPLHGTLVPDPNHSYAFLYTPTPGFTGPDSFTYRVRDIDNQTSANFATASLFVYPRAFAGLNYSIEEGGTLSLSSEGIEESNITGSVGHGQLTYTWVIDPNFGNPFPWSLPPDIFDDPRAIHTANPMLSWDDLAHWGIVNGNVENGIVALQVEDENHIFDTDFARLTVGNVNPELTSFTITSLGCGTDVTMNATILEANPNDQLNVFIDWDILTFENPDFSPDEQNLGAPGFVSPGPSGTTYSISVPLHHYAGPGYVWPILRVVADGGDNGDFPDTFDAINLGTVTNGVDNPIFGDGFPVFINVGAGGGTPVEIDLANSAPVINEGGDLELTVSGTMDLDWKLISGPNEIALTSTTSGDDTILTASWSQLAQLGIVDSSPTAFSLELAAAACDCGCGDPEPVPVSLTVNNVAPVVAPIAGPSAGVRNQVLVYSSNFTDVDADEANATTTWQVLGPQSSSGTGTSFTFTPTVIGTYTVNFTVNDLDGGVTSATPVTVTVTANLVQGGVQYIGGTGAADSMNLKQSDIPTGATRVVIYAGDGDDDIQFAGSVTTPVWIFGGAGNDKIKGGGGADVIVGGDGDDTLMGRDGRDILIGGSGADKIIGNADEDILISGTVDFANLPAALAAIQSEWLSSRTYAERTANVQGPSNPSGLNGNYFLIQDGANANVLDDGVKDTLTGDEGRDWYFANLDGDDLAKKDKITDLSASEFAEDIDWINSP